MNFFGGKDPEFATLTQDEKTNVIHKKVNITFILVWIIFIVWMLMVAFSILSVVLGVFAMKSSISS